MASGLRVPKPYGDYLILDILKKSKGTAVSATDEEILEATRHWAKVEGIFAAPEGAASLVAYRKLRANGFFKPEDTVVLFNTGSGLKYLDVLDVKCGRTPCSKPKPAAPAKSAASSARTRNRTPVRDCPSSSMSSWAKWLRERSERNHAVEGPCAPVCRHCSMECFPRIVSSLVKMIHHDGPPLLPQFLPVRFRR